MDPTESFAERFARSDRMAALDRQPEMVAEAKTDLLSRKECLGLLLTSRVGRLAVSIEALPAILPVNYLALGESVWLRTRSDSTLFRASVGSVVAFEADGYDEIGSFGWSVLVRGMAQEADEGEGLEIVRSLWVLAWPLGDDADRFIVMPTTIIAGQRFAGAA